MAGGYDYPPGALGHAEIYDLDTGVWNRVGDLQTARAGVRLVVLGERILAMGGTSSYPDYIFHASVEEFDMNTGTWRYAEDMMEARAEHGVVAVPPNIVGL